MLHTSALGAWLLLVEIEAYYTSIITIITMKNSSEKCASK